MKDTYYLVYRVYSQKERPKHLRRDRQLFYGWTQSKHVIKALFSQRDKSKYQVFKVDDEQIAEEYSDNNLETDTMIDMIKLKSSLTKDEITFITTLNELREAETDIQRHFRELCELTPHANDSLVLMNLFVNLKSYYGDALDFIGFIPPEIDQMFVPVENTYDDSDVEDMVNDAYTSYYGYPYETLERSGTIPGLSIFPEVYMKIIYSIESFIKVLKEDL